ncbi:hypothetical protein Pcinc_012225 [Petrolisthes cinctipes]|uniref:Uncharacterized protein n=1 Tax=Petrolisthes cinctipes TaxID=88211 RepID=A0AAE1KSS9_PETCI|nr:hypothetical protein Pcinc_012225 [Petrolisthes cinctipes]
MTDKELTGSEHGGDSKVTVEELKGIEEEEGEKKKCVVVRMEGGICGREGSWGLEARPPHSEPTHTTPPHPTLATPTEAATQQLLKL